MKTSSLLLCIALLCCPVMVAEQNYVPDEKTAIAIAEAVLIPIYGKEKIESARPFKAKLSKGVWYIEPASNCDLSWREDGKKPDCFPKAPFVRLSKRDGRIISVIDTSAK